MIYTFGDDTNHIQGMLRMTLTPLFLPTFSFSLFVLSLFPPSSRIKYCAASQSLFAAGLSVGNAAHRLTNNFNSPDPLSPSSVLNAIAAILINF